MAAASEAKIQMTARQAYAAIFFVIFVIAVIGASNVGLITNPLTAGAIITMTTVLIMIGHLLVQKRILTPEAIPVWYMFVAGLMLIIAGGVMAGMIAPAFIVPGATVAEIALTSALFYTLVIIAAASAILAYLVYTNKIKLPGMKRAKATEEAA